METVTHQDRTTAYRVSDRGGDGPTLLLVHGAGGSHRTWKGQFRLSDEYPVAALDLAGHGDSDDVDADPGWTTLSAYADDVLAVAREVDADVLVGHSIGGAVVQHVVLERDRAWNALVLVGTGARLAVMEDLRVWLAEDFDRAVDFLLQSDAFFHDPTPEMVDHSRQQLAETGRAVTERDFLTAHTFDVREEVHRIETPALALTGEDDQLTPPWYHEFFAEELPDCTWTTLPEAAHLSMYERPAAFNERLTAFLDDLE